MDNQPLGPDKIRQEKLIEIDRVLTEFSTELLEFNDAQIVEYDKRLGYIYAEGFRHEYSRIFLQLSLIKKDSTKDINLIAENLKLFCNAQNKSGCSYIPSLRKLVDHVSLDVARINYTEEVTENQRRILMTNVNSVTKAVDSVTKAVDAVTKAVSRVNEVEGTIQQVSNDAKEATGQMKDIKVKQDNIQRDYVAILGIFASILIAFVGGISFSNSILNNLSSASIYRISFAIIMVGFVLISTMYVLFRFILKITDVDDESETVKTGLDNTYQKLVEIFGFLLLITFMLWFIGAIDVRRTFCTWIQNYLTT